MAFAGRRNVVLFFIVQWVIKMTASLDQLSYSIREEMPRQTFVGNLSRDINTKSDSLPEIRFVFLKDGTSREDLFILDPISGVLMTSQRIDRDEICAGELACDLLLNVQILASQLLKIVKVQVTIVDINDNAPEFGEPAVYLSLSESSQPGTKLNLPGAVDPDGPEFGIKKYELLGADGVFSLADGANPDEVQLVLASHLDRETREMYQLRLVAVDGGLPAKSGSLDVNVRVLDTNDNSPTFDRTTYDVTIAEDVRVKTIILYVHATDPDLGSNGEIRYAFTDKTNQSYGDTFAVDDVTGALMVVGKLDYQRQSSYSLYVTARDRGHGSVVGLATVKVNVLDVNDHAPDIRLKTPLTADGKLTVAENARNDSFVAHVTVEDRDVGENGAYTCTLDSDYFRLEQMYTTDYKLVTAATFDRETRDEYVIVMTCTDKGQEARSSSLSMTVAITDVNDHRPIFDPAPLIYAEVEEGNQSGTPIVEIVARDEDVGDNGRVTYFLENVYRGLFSIDPETGLISCNGIIDRELIGEFNMTVIARDGGTPALSSSAVLIIHVIDVDDERPVFSSALYRFTVAENRDPGVFVGSVKATDADAPGNNAFTYSVSNASEGFEDFFALDSLTGAIWTTGILDREMTSSYSAVVSVSSTTADDASVTNWTSHASVQILVLDVNDNAPEFVYPSKTDYRLTVDPGSIVTGQTIARIRAVDNDTDVNVVCEYRIVGDRSGDILTLDPYNGSLIVQRDPDRIPEQTLTVDVIAFDCGTPQLNATGKLVVIFTRTSFGGLSRNGVIVVVICVITAITASILVILIVRLIRKRRNRKYNWIPRVIDIKINTVAEAVEADDSLKQGNEIKMKTESFSQESDQSRTESFDLVTTDLDLDVDSGCGSGLGGSSTPSGTSSIPDWTDPGSDPSHLTPSTQLPGSPATPRVHECDGLRLFSTLDTANGTIDRGQSPRPGGTAPPQYVGSRSDGGKPPRQTQVRFLLPPDVSSVVSDESTERVIQYDA